MKVFYYCIMDLLLPDVGAFTWAVFCLLLLFVLYALYHILTKLPSGRGNHKLAWLLAIILMPFVGALAYFLSGRSKKYFPKGAKCR